MDFYFNVRFDSWEEYSAFCAHAETFFKKKQAPATSSKPQRAKSALKQKKAQPKAAPAPTETVVQKTQIKASKIPAIHQIQGYQPSKTLINKINDLIAKGESFKAVDVAKGAMKNSNYKAKVNRWLQAHPALTYSYQKTTGKGKGPIVYTPVENGKAVLPPGEKPQKTDWPIKGASYRPSYHPKPEWDENDKLEAELIASLDSTESQVAS